MEEKKRQLLEVSARLNTIRCNIEAIKERQRRQKRHRHSKQLAVAKMLLSWEGGNLAKAQSLYVNVCAVSLTPLKNIWRSVESGGARAAMRLDAALASQRS